LGMFRVIVGSVQACCGCGCGRGNAVVELLLLLVERWQVGVPAMWKRVWLLIQSSLLGLRIPLDWLPGRKALPLEGLAQPG